MQGQVAINTSGDSPDGTAMLDITSGDRGLLIPRLALVNATDPISSEKPVGLLVWNTSLTGNYPIPGFYYWNGADWTKLATGTTGVTGTGSTNQVTYWTGSGSLGGQAELYWNPTLKRLGIGTSTPNQQLEITGNFRMPIATTNTAGGIYAGNDRFIHTRSSGAYVGVNSGNLSSTGSFNAVLGNAALYNVSSGGSNTAIGHQSMYTASSASLNTAVGFNSMFSISTARFNTCLGYEALYSNSTGWNNIAIGKYALRGGSNIFYNIAIGDSAGFTNTGNYNIFLGRESGNSVSGNKNIYIGMRAGYSSGSGTLNIGIGDSAAYYGYGNNNISLGRKSGYWNQGGDYNIYLGNSCGFGNNNDPNHNVLIGHGSAHSLTSGSRNTFLGNYTGYAVTIGLDNVLIGDSAGYYLNEGYSNVLVGQAAGKNCNALNANNNTFVGYHAGYLNTTGWNNVFLGTASGPANTTGWDNIFIGKKAGKNLSTGYSNIFIGVEAGSGISNGHDNIVIGNAGIMPSGSYNIIHIGTRAGFPAIWAKYESVVIAGDSSNNTASLTFFVWGTAGGPSAWQTISDSRYKKNIVPITSAMDKVARLQGIYYELTDPKEGLEGQKIGFIAQDIEKVLPQVVSSNNGSYSIQYAPVTALLTEAIKEQQSMIDSQQMQLDDLQKQLEILKVELAAMKQVFP